MQSTLLSFFLYLFQKFGSQLQVILQKHLHSDTLAREAEPPFVQHPPHPGENTLCLGTCCWNTEILPCKPHKGWILLHSGPPPSQGIIVNDQGRLVSVPAGDKSSLMMMKRMISAGDDLLNLFKTCGAQRPVHHHRQIPHHRIGRNPAIFSLALASLH